jgi:hypothetical protein
MYFHAMGRSPHCADYVGLDLWREIKAQGYTGSDRSVYRHLATLKRVEVKASVNVERVQKFSANTAI